MLAIPKNIPVRLLTGFVVQGHILKYKIIILNSNNISQHYHFYGLFGEYYIKW